MKNVGSQYENINDNEFLSGFGELDSINRALCKIKTLKINLNFCLSLEIRNISY